MSKVRQRNLMQERQSPSSKPRTLKTEPASDSNGLSLCTRVLGIAVAIIVAIGLLGFYQAPYTCLTPERLSVEVKLDGPFAFKNTLKQGTKIPGLPSPESIAEDGKGNLYTGLADGRIIKIKPSDNGRIGAGDLINVTSGIIKDISRAMKKKSGRPLGLRVQDETLYVADANYGIYTVNTQTGKVKMLIKVTDVNPPLSFTDDLDISRDGKYIYFSDMSIFSIDEMLYGIYKGDCDGRVFCYNTETKKIEIVASNLCFANGVQLSQDEQSLFVVELAKSVVRIIDLATSKTVKMLNIPIMADNIRATGKGTYWVAGGILRTTLYSFLERNPIVRQIVIGLLSQESLFKLLLLSAHYNLVLEINEKGDILQSFHDPNCENYACLAQAITLSDGRLALSTYVGDHISIVNAEDAIAVGRV
ncbi:unnamed protein product [Clavelina lepadiformis]|uniref:Strictosidine synthase conserved region domain-containing protein n=1 Tax=Clavelina lepadiformis TaxID=159417 RepID=A0ABP0FT47_CLALP